MYWPIRAPRIYAAKVPPPSIPIDYDSEESAELVRHSLSFSEAADDAEQNDSTKGSTEDEDEGRKVGEKEVRVEDEESLSGSAGGKVRASTASAALDEETRSHIVALRVARSGLLFAAVTRAELTIWQMKVLRAPSRRSGLQLTST
jgi:hypothetical protein